MIDKTKLLNLSLIVYIPVGINAGGIIRMIMKNFGAKRVKLHLFCGKIMKENFHQEFFILIKEKPETNILPHMETGPRFKLLSNILEKLGMEPATPGLQDE